MFSVKEFANRNYYLFMVNLKQKINYSLVNIHTLLIKYLYGMSLLLAALEGGGAESNTPSMGNKEELLETCTCLQGYDVIGITELWWDGP